MLRRNFIKSLSAVLAVSVSPLLSVGRSFSKKSKCMSLGKPTCSNTSTTKSRGELSAKLASDFLADELRNSWARSPIDGYVLDFDHTLARIASMIKIQATG